ncbi:hypothetical protein D3C81_1909420 [compost metagenome]
MISIIATKTGGVVALGVLCCQVDVVGVILQTPCVGGRFITVAKVQTVLVICTF